jgi:hypothetical protein
MPERLHDLPDGPLAISLDGMDAAHASLELLAHFDGPAARGTTCRTPTRGVGWVLQWSAAIATLFFAVSLLTQFAYGLAAELTLARAARAGALEATLPRATYHSVAQSIARRLDNLSQPPPNRMRFSLLHNGAPVSGMIQAGEGDRLSVTVAVPMYDVLPRWLRTACFWQADAQIEARAERLKPGRQLPGP